MLSLTRRIQALEEAMRRAGRRSKVIVVFSSGDRMKITGGMEYNGTAAEGEKLLVGLDGDYTIIRFNIPRPGMVMSKCP